jgi:cytochrome b561
MLRNTVESWGTPAKLLHWIVAVLVFAQFALGWTAAKWRLSPVKLDLFVWHKSIGMLVLTLVLVRIVWRLANPTPDPPADTPRWEKMAASASHLALYALLLAMPFSGWIINSADNIPFRVFRLVPLPALVAPSDATAELAKGVHFALFVALAALLCIHVAAALRHHYAKRNDVLTRMLPRRRSAA